MAQILDGKASANALKRKVKERIAGLAQPPSLAVVLVGQNPASLTYVRGKGKACAETGIRYQLHTLDENVPQEELLTLIDRLNEDIDINGILVQQPLPDTIDRHAVVSRVDPLKDVDCLHPLNIGLMTTGRGVLHPCTPAGVITLLKDNEIILEGKRCVILGRSEIVGKPLAMMMLAQNATVTICHSRTVNLKEVCQTAEILVAAIGKPRFVTAGMITENAVVVDVGINRLQGKKICGDVDYKDCFEKAAYITPVPGGVGPMTIATLMENTLKAWEQQHA